MFSIQIHRDEVLIKTNLSENEIIVYTEQIIRQKDWADTISNRIRAKSILDALVILENHLQSLNDYSLFPFPVPTLRNDFQELSAMLYRSQRDN